jgi:predicted cation transporter
MDLLVNGGLFVIFLLVLVLPFKVKQVEHNLEVFLFFCGVVALTLSVRRSLRLRSKKISGAFEIPDLA